MFQKQERILILVCFAVAVIMLYATIKSAFRYLGAPVKPDAAPIHWRMTREEPSETDVFYGPSYIEPDSYRPYAVCTY
ncbi:hypothetical protein [Paenibacillus ihumii]|uniref:hypothetical protein n=1 Tax=Paenibacillus ihumii TaxID=687436 RepID=UPI0011DDCF25|nr:hypothetical protein [Paenibacillus ihumii]